ncbi:MAG: phage holin family protein [Mycobacteriaceae bacterium]|uniref:phage holin family protein n=1 Tax=Corynebacterium sp. TaxID=1720 RepID=UPI003F943181
MGFFWNFLVRAVGTAAALWVVVYFVAGVHVTAPVEPLVGDGANDQLWVFLGSAVVILLLNMTVKPVLRLLGLPLTILTLGLFALVINAFVFMLAGTLAQAIGLGLTVDSFGAAFWGAIIMAVVNWILGPLTGLLSARR